MPDAEAAPTVENVRVVVRVRPMDQREKLDGASSCVSVDPVHHTIAVARGGTPAEPARVYAYDAVFDCNTSQACIIGKETKKCLYLGIKNKYCFHCHMYEKQNKTVPYHTCFRNYEGPSTGMEAAVLVVGFQKSEEMHGVQYLSFIGDGDSSVYAQLKDNVSYGSQIKKIECKNHVMKNYTSALYKMDIYVQTARPIVEEVLKGYNGTIFAYGQTGTGKTYTMAGSNSAPQLRGIIPNSFAHVFSHIADATDDEKFLVCVTYLEIYNEEVRDLLGNNPHQSLEVKERPDIGVFVKDLTGYVVHNADELEKIMAVGNKNRHIGATAMNTESSRSHAIFSITVESSKKGADNKMHVKMGKLHLVDLAGSERQSKTHATGTRLKEATKINQSLSVLGNVISALVDGKSTHIPYRNSKLTRLLQDSLGGNSKTVMIATVGPADTNYVETISTLRYANRAKNIENKTHVNNEPGDALLTRFQQEIDQLKKQLEDSNNVEEEEEEEKEVSEEEEELSDDGLSSSLDSLDPEEKKLRRKMKREEREKINQEKAHQARKVLEEKKAELQRTKKQQEELKEKLQRLESKVLVGGENLLDKADTQRQLLEQAARELEQRKQNELRLQQDLQKKEAERLDLEERYTSLQEENAAKTRKLKRAVQLLNSAKAELADQQREQQREMEGILDSVRALRREIQLADLVLDAYIPKEYQALIDQYVHWNEQLGEWQVKCVAYTGNNMAAPHHRAATQQHKHMEPVDLSSRYMSYSCVNPRPTSRLARPHTSAVPRPHTALRQRQ